MSGSWLFRMETLTDIQAQVFDTVKRRLEQGEPAPSYRELCAEFGWASTGTARDHLRALAKKGYLELPGKRGGRVRMRTNVSSTTVPILGRVVAGVPITAEENVEGFLPIPTTWSGSGEYFALRVFGDSMKNAGILEDDHVIIRKQEIANDGDIVAVTVEGETTLKRLKQQKEKTLLVPENSDYQPIDITTASTVVHGVVVGLLRAYGLVHRKNPFLSNRTSQNTNRQEKTITLHEGRGL